MLKRLFLLLACLLLVTATASAEQMPVAARASVAVKSGGNTNTAEHELRAKLERQLMEQTVAKAMQYVRGQSYALADEDVVAIALRYCLHYTRREVSGQYQQLLGNYEGYFDTDDFDRITLKFLERDWEVANQLKDAGKDLRKRYQSPAQEKEMKLLATRINRVYAGNRPSLCADANAPEGSHRQILHKFWTEAAAGKIGRGTFYYDLGMYKDFEKLSDCAYNDIYLAITAYASEHNLAVTDALFNMEVADGPLVQMLIMAAECNYVNAANHGGRGTADDSDADLFYMEAYKLFNSVQHKLQAHPEVAVSEEQRAYINKCVSILAKWTSPF